MERERDIVADQESCYTAGMASESMTVGKRMLHTPRGVFASIGALGERSTSPVRRLKTRRALGLTFSTITFRILLQLPFRSCLCKRRRLFSISRAPRESSIGPATISTSFWHASTYSVLHKLNDRATLVSCVKFSKTQCTAASSALATSLEVLTPADHFHHSLRAVHTSPESTTGA